MTETEKWTMFIARANLAMLLVHWCPKLDSRQVKFLASAYPKYELARILICASIVNLR